MKKETLIKELQKTKGNKITIKQVYDIFGKSINEFYMRDLEQEIERIFKLDDMRKKTRKREYVIARSTFSYLSIKNGIGCVQISKASNQEHGTVLHGYKKFHEYCRWYHEYEERIKRVLQWDIEQTE